MKEKKAVTRQVRSHYLKAGRKEKSAILDEFIQITGYKNRKYALHILNKPQAPLVVTGKTVKLKPQKKRPANRQSKKIYTDEVIASLRLIWAFFWYKCGRKRSFRKLLAPLIRQHMPFIASWPAFAITPDIREKLMKISPRTRFRGRDHRPRPQKRQGCPRPHGQKSHQTGKIPQTPHPHPHLLHLSGTKTPRFYPD
ncbi:hypothetical protein [Treponema sp. TIM-1]|uniref:hypothetical protein n=1 Tax=Treponema sp. TIM-1 TaxID=2898417 RepID=UPI0039807972